MLLAACGGGGGGDGGNGGGGGAGGAGGGGTTPTGRLIVQTSNNLSVFDFATRRITRHGPTRGSANLGITASDAGLIADHADTGGDAWTIELRRASDGSVARRFPVEHAYGFPTSPPAISADSTRIAYGVNELGSDDERHDRTYVFGVAGGAARWIEGVDDPVWVARTGELVVRFSDDGLRIFSPALVDLGALPLRVDLGESPHAATPDGRYVAHERDSQIWIYDRAAGRSWQATRAPVWGRNYPVFSPDGRWLAMLGRGELTFNVRIVHVIPFVPGTTSVVDRPERLYSEFDESLDGSDRMAWIPS